VLAPLDVNGRGLEVAPYFNPVTDKSVMDVAFTDVICYSEIKRKAFENPGGRDKIVPEIDFVWWPGEELCNCIPGDEIFDFAVASHVMEHVPNPVGWLNEILAVMRDGAKLAIILPDKRVNMDYFRQETTPGQMLGWWAEQPAVPISGQIYDFLSSTYQTREGGAPAFKDGVSPADLDRCYSNDKALEYLLWSHNEAEYIDIHCTVWTPDSFVSVMRHLSSIGVMNVDVSDPITQTVDFAVHLTKRGSPRIAKPLATSLVRAKRRVPHEPTLAEGSINVGIKGSLKLLVRALARRLALA